MTQTEEFREGLDRRGIKYSRASSKNRYGYQSIDVTSFFRGCVEYDFAEIVHDDEVSTFITSKRNASASDALNLIDSN